MRTVFAALVIALTVGSATSGAQAASSGHKGRWCVVSGVDYTRHCYFQRHRDCIKAIADGSGTCVPHDKRRGEMPEDSSK